MGKARNNSVVVENYMNRDGGSLLNSESIVNLANAVEIYDDD